MLLGAQLERALDGSTAYSAIGHAGTDISAGMRSPRWGRGSGVQRSGHPGVGEGLGCRAQVFRVLGFRGPGV